MYPIDVRAEYGDGRRSRGLAALGALFFLKAVLLIPHFIVLWALGIASAVLVWIGYVVVLFTGRISDVFFEFPARVMAWQTRVSGWFYGFEDAYPPFEWEPAGYSVELHIDEAPGPRSRGLALLGIFALKALLLLPHIVVLFFVAIVAGIALWIGYLVVLFTGRYPQGMFEFLLGTLRWSTRITAWQYTLTDRYPPFSLS